jgi:hypothetical protein
MNIGDVTQLDRSNSYMVNMKHQIFSCALFLAVLLSSKICYTQEKRYPFEEIKPDCICPDFEWNNRGHLELKDISQSVHDLEIRLDVHAKWHDRMIIQIIGNAGKYEGYFYHKRTESFYTHEKDSIIKYKGKWEKYNFKKFRLTDVNLDSVVKVLLAHQITTLPYQNEIYKKGFLSPYFIRYKIDGKTRSFQFGSPEDPIREFPDEPVYRHYDAILKTFWPLINPMYIQIWKDVELQQKKEERDTIFLRRPSAEGHSIYVDKDARKSPYFRWLKSLDYTNADKDYARSMKELQKYKKNDGKKADLSTMSRHWVQLHLYKGKYYAYSPSNRSQVKISLNDSTLITMGMERRVDLINDVQQTEKNVYQISTTDYKGQSGSFRIHIIDAYRDIAVFENLFEKGSHLLMVTAERADRFPLITNYSPNHMEPEFVFDVPDFKGLMNPERN